jgi:hypothetical protein
MSIYNLVLNGKKGLRSRYFRRNAGTGYASIPNITFSADFAFNFNVNAPVQDNRKAISFRNTASLNEFNITSSLIGNDGKLRVFSNAIPAVNTATSMDVFDNIFHTVRFEYSIATTSFRVLVDGVQGIAPTTTGYDFSTSDLINLWRQVGDGGYMAGIISDLEMYDAGSLVRDYPINDNSGTLVDLVSGEDGTIVNGTADQWGLFQKQATGEWTGKELIVNGGFDTDLSGWTITEAGQTVEWDNGRLHIITDGTGAGVQQTPFTDGQKYRVSLNYEAISGSLKYQVGSSGFPVSTTQAINSDYVADSPNFFLYRNSGSGEGYFDNVSAKEVLDVA